MQRLSVGFEGRRGVCYAAGMVHEDLSKTTRLRYRARLAGHPVESYEARAAWQAVPTYGTRVVQLESVIELGVIWVKVTVAW